MAILPWLNIVNHGQTWVFSQGATETLWQEYTTVTTFRNGKNSQLKKKV